MEDAETLTEVILQVKDVFRSHNVEGCLTFLENKKKELREKKVGEVKKTIEEMVKDDLKFFLEKRKLKAQEKGAQAVSSATSQ